jgi:transcriptional regulator with XRE-family HTH domain
MSYTVAAIGETLKAARARKGWSQRMLSSRAGLPQGHISRIENGAVDLKMSSLIELARTLDLDLVLAPRAALPAVQALIREAEDNQQGRSALAAAAALDAIARRLIETVGDVPTVRRLTALADDLPGLMPLLQSPADRADLVEGVAQLEGVADARPVSPETLARAVRRLTDLRNRLVHRGPSSHGPAYSLDDED